MDCVRHEGTVQGGAGRVAESRLRRDGVESKPSGPILFEPEGSTLHRAPVGLAGVPILLCLSLRAKILAPCNRSASLLFAKTLPRIARIARMGKRRIDMESRTCLSVKSVKSVVHSIFPPIYCIVAETPKLSLIKANQGQSRLIKVKSCYFFHAIYGSHRYPA